MGKRNKAESEAGASKTRKVVAGPVREKGRSMARLVAAVGKVIPKKGYTALTGTNIAKEAGLDKSLIWSYFGNVDKLVETYILARDFWSSLESEKILEMVEKDDSLGKEEIIFLLHGQLERLNKDKILQQIIHWEIGKKNKTLRTVADRREEIGERLFQIIEPSFTRAGVDIRAGLALQIAGIYYLVLHARQNGSLFCGLDINKPEDLERLRRAIAENVLTLYDRAGITE